jgi:hypothetical protein
VHAAAFAARGFDPAQFPRYLLGMTFLRSRIEELPPIPAVAPRPPFVHVPA